MPLYVYRCEECEKEFEVFYSFADSQKIPECPFCKSASTKKQIANFASSGVTPVSDRWTGGSSCGGSGRFT